MLFSCWISISVFFLSHLLLVLLFFYVLTWFSFVCNLNFLFLDFHLLSLCNILPYKKEHESRSHGSKWHQRCEILIIQYEFLTFIRLICNEEIIRYDIVFIISTAIKAPQSYGEEDREREENWRFNNELIFFYVFKCEWRFVCYVGLLGLSVTHGTDSIYT